MLYVFADWKSVADYPSPDTTTETEWAWQFLRRNPEFQRDYDELVRPFAGAGFGMHLLEDLNCCICDPPALPSETRDQYWERIQRDGITEYKAITKPWCMAQKWGLEDIPPAPEDKKGRKPPGLSVIIRPVFRSIQSKCMVGDNPISTDTRSTDAWFRFDLSLPLEKQLERAKQWLTSEQKYLQSKGDVEVRAKRNHVARYREYLRILDADQADADIKDMATVVFPDVANEYPDYLGSKKVRNALSAAKRLRDTDWALIFV